MSLFNNNNYTNDKFKSLNQGLGMLSERKNSILSLKKNINHSKDNIVEGFIEGATTMNNCDTIVMDDCDTGTVDEKIKCYKDKHECKGMQYQTTMESYNEKYKTFLENFNKTKTDVSNCKLKCFSDSDSPQFTITSDDFGDGLDPNKVTLSKYKTMAKKACNIGCHLNLPTIMECGPHEKFGKVETFPSELTEITNGMTCNQIYGANPIWKEKVNTFGENGGANVRTDLLSILDASGNNAYDHCCQGKLEEKFKPYKIMHNTKYTDCTQFDDPSIDPAATAGGSAITQRNACQHGQRKFTDTTGNYQFSDRYKEIVQDNKDMMITSTEILDIVTDLKALGETIVQSKNEESMKFRNDNELYETILTNIKDNSDPLKVNTLNQFIKDKTLLKKSTDLRLHVWFVLALGFGVAALMKIKQL